MKVKITLITQSLGDTIGAVSQVDRYQKKTDNEVGFFINKNFIFLFKNSYPNLSFNPIGFKFDEEKFIDFNFHTPLPQSFSEGLDIDYEEVNTKIDEFHFDKPLPQKYITISSHSTHQGRYWNNKDGWNDLVKYIKSKYHISVVSIDKYNTFGLEKRPNTIPKKSIDRTGINLETCVGYIRHAEFHIGTSNGLCWLAHALNKHVMLISNVTQPWCEFTTNVTRIYDDTICNGCFNSPDHKFNPNDWMWCPENKNFECTKKITFNSIKEKLDNCLKKYE